MKDVKLYADAVRRASSPDPGVVSMLADTHSSYAQRIAGCRHLIEMGALRGASVALKSMLRDAPNRAEVLSLLSVCDELKSIVESEGEPYTDAEYKSIDLDKGDIWISSGGHKSTILAFAGAAIKVGISVFMLQRILARFACNTVILFDHRKSYYLGGIESLGNNLTATLDKLKEIIRGLGSERTYCLGQSLGGYAAIYCGQALDARAVLAFSPLVRNLLDDRHDVAFRS